MSRHRRALPQLSDRLFLTDGGLETTLVFHQGIELPHFAAFDLLRRPGGDAVLLEYFARYTGVARRVGAGFVFESATWRANPDWATKLGYSREHLAAANRRAIAMLEDLRTEFEASGLPGVVSGCVGPRGDGYVASDLMTVREAEDYHREQIEVFAGTTADLVSAITMTNVNEAVGITHAARNAGVPVVISFTVETDGRLPSGQPLGEAIAQVEGDTGGAPAYYMINCAHPTHFTHVLSASEAWIHRVRGLRANASHLSHAELNEAPTLDDGNPEEFGRQHAQLWGLLPRLSVLGGCCGTDHRHVERIARECAPLYAAGA